MVRFFLKQFVIRREGNNEVVTFPFLSSQILDLFILCDSSFSFFLVEYGYESILTS